MLRNLIILVIIYYMFQSLNQDLNSNLISKYRIEYTVLLVLLLFYFAGNFGLFYLNFYPKNAFWDSIVNYGFEIWREQWVMCAVFILLLGTILYKMFYTI
jgi:hypothetical protein